MELGLSMNYVELDQEEMIYLDGGLYFSNSSIKVLAAGICSNIKSVSMLASAVKNSALLVGAKLSAIIGPISWLINGLIAAWIMVNALEFAEKAVTAIVLGKGVNYCIEVKWGIIPSLGGSVY